MTKFKIENFCVNYNEEFNLYYNYLNNQVYINLLYFYLSQLNTDKMKDYIMNLIKNNHKYVIDKLNKVDIIISYYKENDLINKSEIGKFFTFYENHRKKINIKDNNDLFKLFYKMIEYDDCINLLKECFYIFSNYRSCIYYMTPSKNFYNPNIKGNKKALENTIKAFKDNINTLNQLVSKIYVGDITLWGSQYYTTAYSMFETLIIIKKYFNNPLEKLNIKFKVGKKCNKKDIFNNLCINYLKNKLKESDIDDELKKENIKSISQFIFILKKLGYDLWYVIDLVFNTIYEKYTIKNVPDAMLWQHNKIYLQKNNNLLGIKCFILTDNGYISNINIFNNFND